MLIVNNMATYKKIRHILYPDSTITLALYSELESCKELRKSVMEGNIVASLLKTAMVRNCYTTEDLFLDSCN